MVNEGRTLLVIPQVSSGFKKIAYSHFSKYEVKIASLATVKCCVTVGSIQMFGLV